MHVLTRCRVLLDVGPHRTGSEFPSLGAFSLTLLFSFFNVGGRWRGPGGDYVSGNNRREYMKTYTRQRCRVVVFGSFLGDRS